MSELIAHDCPIEGPMMIEAGKPCNWCGELDDAKVDMSETPMPNEWIPCEHGFADKVFCEICAEVIPLRAALAERDAEIARLRKGVLVPEVCTDATVEAMIEYMPWALSELQCRGLYKAAIDAAKDGKGNG